MKLHDYAETNSLYIELTAGPGTDTREITEGLNVDLDAEGEVVGFDIDHASTHLDLATLRDHRSAAAADPRRLMATGRQGF